MKKITVTLLTSVFCFLIFSQQMPSMPEMPAMPEIEMPKVGGGFYQPKIPYYPKTTQTGKTETTETKTEQTLSDANTSNTLLTSLLNSNSMLTASDITSLSDSGLFTGLSSLYGTNTSLISSTSSSDIILQQILTTLEELKAEQKKNSSSDNETLSRKQQDLTTFKEREPSILRFKINGYDMKDSLTTVYFSKPEADGSFLLTADRKYIADRKQRTETFYLLFRATESQGHTITYSVEPSLMQDSQNENSYIYKLCSQKKLTATKTGNLVVLRSDSKDATVDLLVDIDG